MHSEEQIVLCTQWLVSSKRAPGLCLVAAPSKPAESPITPDLSWTLLFPAFIILSSNVPFIENSLAALQFPGSHWNFLRTSIIFNNVDLLVKGSLQFSPRRVFGRSSECSFWQTLKHVF